MLVGVIGFGWMAVSLVYLVPTIGRRMGASVFEGVRWKQFLVLTAGAGTLCLMHAAGYWRASRLVFTSAGFGYSRRESARFILWSEVENVELRETRGRGFEILLYGVGREWKIRTGYFGDPYAISRFVRERVPEGLGSSLPTEGDS